MNEDRRSGTLIGLVVFVGSIAGLFLIARLTHVAMALVKDPSGIPAETWTQAGMVVLGAALAACLVAAIRLMLDMHRPRLRHHGPAGHSYSGRAL